MTSSTENNMQEEPLEQVVSNGHDGDVGGSAFYSYAVLSAGFSSYSEEEEKYQYYPLSGIDELPDNVDPGKREEFLTDAEFLEVPLPSNQSYFLCQTNL